jgi:hypothetical protein
MNRRQILIGVAVLVAGLGVAAYIGFNHYIDRLVNESGAPGMNSANIHLSGALTPTSSHPLSGFWKGECNENFGLAVAAAGPGLYSVSFCGPDGCFKPGHYRPNTPIVGDPEYKLDESAAAFTVRGNDGSEQNYKRCWPAAGNS